MEGLRYTFDLDDSLVVEVVMSTDFDPESVRAPEHEVLKAAADRFLDLLKQERSPEMADTSQRFACATR